MLFAKQFASETAREVDPRRLRIDPAWPSEVSLVISALEAADAAHEERRHLLRHNYFVMASLRLFVDNPSNSVKSLYTRNANPRGLGFVAQHPLPLGYGGVVHLAAPAGQQMAIACTVLRCRLVAPSWYEGGLFFNREQPMFFGEEPSFKSTRFV